MVAVTATPVVGGALVADELLDRILNDSDLLRDEFDAIIAASWPGPPDPPRMAPPAAEPSLLRPGTHRDRPHMRSGAGDPGPGCIRAPAEGRQRSPPHLTRPPAWVANLVTGCRAAISADTDRERQVMASTGETPSVTF